MWSWGIHRRTVSAQVGVQKPLTNCHGVHRINWVIVIAHESVASKIRLRPARISAPPYEPLPEERHLEEGISGEQRHRRGDVTSGKCVGVRSHCLSGLHAWNPVRLWFVPYQRPSAGL
jgi:hypothetical protein